MTPCKNCLGLRLQVSNVWISSVHCCSHCLSRFWTVYRANGVAAAGYFPVAMTHLCSGCRVSCGARIGEKNVETTQVPNHGQGVGARV